MLAALDVDDWVQSHIKSLAKACNSLSSLEQRALAKAVEISKEVMQVTVKTMVDKNIHQPMLRSSQSDGTPIRYKVREVLDVAGKLVTLRGKGSTEFQVGLSMYRTFSQTDGEETGALLQDPQPLTEGKKSPALFETDKHYWLSLRQLGHQGIAIEHYAWDRGCFSSLSQLWKQWHSMMSTSWGTNHTMRSAEILWLQEWVIATPCVNHDINKAIEWAMWFDDSTKEMLTELHIALESLRNSFDVIVKHIGRFIAQRLEFADALPEQDLDPLRSLWFALGFNDEMVSMLVDVLELRWTDGKYIISKDVEGMASVSLVQTALLKLWRWKQFTASRFLGIGKCTAVLTASLLTGIAELVASIVDEETTSLYYLKGFGRLSTDVRVWAVQASLASRPMEAVQSICLKDGRVVKQLPEIRAAMSKAISTLETLDSFVWDALSEVCKDLDSASLRDSVLRIAYISCGFFRYRTLDAAEGLPWSLACGDIQTNLSWLYNQPEPTEPTTWKIWCLLHISWNRHELQSGVSLLLQICWRTLPSEQYHGTVAALHRHHPDYELNTLRSRATILQVNKLLPTSTFEFA